MPRSKGRTGRPWRRARDRVKRTSTTCWICGEPIDTTLDHRDPYSFTVDHVEPLSRRPDLARDPRNLKPAHRRCNSARGTGRQVHTTPTPSRNW